jgi:mono/diheme cytochrome c family protein
MIMEVDEEEGAQLVGNAARGETLFREHPVASCVRCHQVGGEGGVVGPALDDIAKRQNAAYIRESLIDPQAAIAKGYPAQVSPMPPFGVLLPAQDVEDLIAYLMTLKQDPPAGSGAAPQKLIFE